MSDTHAGEVLTTQDGKPLKAALAKGAAPREAARPWR